MNSEYLESLSLFDLYELRKFYEQFSPGVMTPPGLPKVDDWEAEKRYDMIEEAIVNKLFDMDTKLFDSSIRRETEKEDGKHF